MKKSKLFLLIVAVMTGMSGFSQSEVFNIGDGTTYTGCDAIMHDSNGGLVPYSPNSDNETTLCAPVGETQINLYFIGFDISDGDVLSIYDGNSTAAPLIGQYSGDILLFETISSTNPDGCLTVTFTSNADDETGDFSMHVFCGVPCDFPVALIGAESDTIRICPGESVNFDGGESFWTEGASLESWTWDFGDNTANTTSWPTVSHTFDEPGGYRIRLYLEDSNNCSSANIPEVVVLVSTDYVFDITTTSDYFCVGNEILIGEAAYVDAATGSFDGESQNGNTVTWIETQTVSFDNGVYIPDNEGCLYTEITFNQFGTAVIDDASDFAFVFINMEHSFVGDIIINIICPTGEVLNLWPEAGGSGTFLGVPIDDESGVPGVGFDYTFSPTSTSGTWLENLASGTIPAGDYEAEGDWMDLAGCPLNGTWELEVCDVVGADDGWVFEFGIQFAPEFYPEVLQFTPEVGNSCDSSYWELPNDLTTTGTGCDWATFTPTVSGNYTFTYHVINDFGCEYTQDVQVVAVAEPIVEAPDAAFCNNGLQLTAAVTNGPPNASYSYSWSPATGLSNPNIQNPTVNNLTDDIVYTVTASAAGLTACSGSDEVNVMVSEPLVPTEPNPQYFCQVDFPFTLESADQINEDAIYEWVWNNENGSNVVSDQQNYDAINYGQFVLTVSEEGCGTQLVVTYYVTPPPPAEAGEGFYFCGDDINLDGSVVNPIPGLQYGYSWSPAELLNNPDQSDALIVANLDTATVFTLSIFPLADPTCISTDTVTVILPELPNLGTLDNIYPCTEELPYTVYGAAQTQPFITYQWTFTNFNGSETIDAGTNPSVTSDQPGVYTLVLTEPNCQQTVQQNITVALQECTIFIPNIMTPNGDGDNDTFEVRGITNFSGSTVQIFNRWGNLVFEDLDYNGKWGGGDVAEGTYYFIVGINKQTGMEYHSGSLTVIR